MLGDLKTRRLYTPYFISDGYRHDHTGIGTELGHLNSRPWRYICEQAVTDSVKIS